MIPWLLGISFGLVGTAWFITEFVSALRFDPGYRSSYVKERINYLTPLYLVGVGALVLAFITWFNSWQKIYVSYVTILGLTIGGKVFFSRVRKGVIRALDVYDLDLDLPVASTALSLVPLSTAIITPTLNLLSSSVLFVESLIMYLRARRRFFDVGWVSALLYSLPLLAIALFSLYLSLGSFIVFSLSAFLLVLFLMDLAYLVIRGI